MFVARVAATLAVITGVDKGGQPPPPMAVQKKERKGVFLLDVQHVYLYSLFN